MQLLQVYSLLVSGEVTHEEAAHALNLTSKDLKFRMTKYGSRLPMVLEVLDKIRSDQMLRPQAAETLGVSVRQVNHLMNTWQVHRPLKEYLVDRAAAKLKWEVRKKFAIDYIAGRLDLDKAAEAAGCSDRQMRRWVSELLIKHFDMPFKDLKLVAERRRLRLAQEIETAEGIEEAKQHLVEAISDGAIDIKMAARERVLRQKHRKKGHV